MRRLFLNLLFGIWVLALSNSGFAGTEEINCVYILAQGPAKVTKDVNALIDEVNGIQVITGIDEYLKMNKKQPAEIMNAKEIKKIGHYFNAKYLIAVYERDFNGWIESNLMLIETESGCVIESVRIGGDLQEKFQREINYTKNSAVWKLAKGIMNQKSAQGTRTGIFPINDGVKGEKYGNLVKEIVMTKAINDIKGVVVLGDDVVMQDVDVKKAIEIGKDVGLDYVCIGSVFWKSDKLDQLPVVECYFIDVDRGKTTGYLKKEFFSVRELRESIDAMDLFQEYFIQPLWQFNTGYIVAQSIAKTRIKVGLEEPEEENAKQAEPAEEDLITEDENTVDYSEKDREVLIFATETKEVGTKEKNKVNPYKPGIFAIDAESGKAIWQSPINVTSFPAGKVAVNKNLVFCADNSGIIYGMANDTGDSIWKYKFSGNVSNIYANDDVVIAGNDKGEIAVIESATGKEIWKKKISDAEIKSLPNYANGVIYVGSCDGNVYAIELQTGNVLWTFASEDAIYSQVLLNENKAYVTGMDKYLYCIDIKTGAEKWKKKFGNSISSDIIPYNDRLLFATNDGTVLCISALDGNQLWSYKMESWCSGSPVLDANVFVGCQDGYVYQVSADDGKLIFKYNAGGAVIGATAVVGYKKGKMLIAVNRDGLVSAFPVKTR